MVDLRLGRRTTCTLFLIENEPAGESTHQTASDMGEDEVRVRETKFSSMMQANLVRTVPKSEHHSKSQS